VTLNLVAELVVLFLGQRLEPLNAAPEDVQRVAQDAFVAFAADAGCEVHEDLLLMCYNSTV